MEECRVERLTISRRSATRLSDVTASAEVPRISTGMNNLDTILGGGLALSSSILIAGDPGAGKTTLMMLVASHLCESSDSVLYLSSEESIENVASRARRIGISESLSLLSASDYDTIESEISSYDFVFIDSLQMISVFPEMPVGSLVQVREATTRLASPHRKRRQTIVLICHITKGRSFAGPMHLQHLVDTTLMFELDHKTDNRRLYAYKNRHGATNKEAHFQMHGEGLSDVGLGDKE